MRRFFRFTVRDLFWLTLVVAMGLGWSVSDRARLAEVEQARRRANQWRNGAGVLEYVVKQSGREVFWNLEKSSLMVEETSAEISAYSLDSTILPPSAGE
jgi:hypothetical protein